MTPTRGPRAGQPAKSSAPWEFWLLAKGCPTAPISTPTPSAARHETHLPAKPPRHAEKAAMWKLLLLATASAVELKQKMIIRNTGSEDLAVYFMGALHEGHLSLVRRAKKKAEGEKKEGDGDGEIGFETHQLPPSAAGSGSRSLCLRRAMYTAATSATVSR